MVAVLCISSQFILLLIFVTTTCSAEISMCLKRRGKRYYRSMSGWTDCTRDRCPPFEKGSHENCYCCNGPDENKVDGGWASWSTWSKCSSLQLDAVRYRIRTCANPAPLRNGELCMSANKTRRMWDYEQQKCSNEGVYVDRWQYIVCRVIVGLLIMAIVMMLIYIWHLRSHLGRETIGAAHDHYQNKHYPLAIPEKNTEGGFTVPNTTLIDPID